MSEHDPGLPASLTGPLRRLLWIVPVGIGGNLVYTLLATDREALGAGLAIAPWWLVATLLIAIAPLGCNTLRVWRWARFLRPGFRLRDAGRTVLLAEVGAAVTPSVIGGSPLKVAWLAHCGLGPGSAFTLAALGSLEDLVVMAIALPCLAVSTGLLPRFVGLLSGALESIAPGRGFLVILLLVLLGMLACRLLLRGPRGLRRRVVLRRWRRELRQDLRLIRRRGLVTFLGNLVLTAVQWGARLSLVAGLAAGLGAPLNWLHAMVLQWICFLVMTVTPTPGAVGGAEAGFLLVFGRELPAALTPLILAAWRLVGFYGLNALALALLTATWGRRRPA
ncbi:MAG: lysylphosphatidylglycerol synthase transmembrane domain-containing protein [Candidatus Krumholzibacteriia bacterium]